MRVLLFLATSLLTVTDPIVSDQSTTPLVPHPEPTTQHPNGCSSGELDKDSDQSDSEEASGVLNDPGSSYGMYEGVFDPLGQLEDVLSSGDSVNGSISPLARDFNNLANDVLTEIARQGFLCPDFCPEVLGPTCIEECVRRGVPELTCRMFCYTVEYTCCHCPPSCFAPLITCYHACKEEDTDCKNQCMGIAQVCCAKRFQG
ncbi:uncharacterized protein [Procambarus clarkii]|uniref:uncharacterized protein n=1 Tax=Procambarus clarkii TaxID=6728 RepID=UPI001E670954|nr:uncharacterized protein LOC123756650 [Procambarus clarkii]